MSLTPPNPGLITKTLRDQLEQLRLLKDANQADTSYANAMKHVEAAISELERRQKQAP
jgi:ABC-type phosphate transport system auxiliary subunit